MAAAAAATEMPCVVVRGRSAEAVSTAVVVGDDGRRRCDEGWGFRLLLLLGFKVVRDDGKRKLGDGNVCVSNGLVRARVRRGTRRATANMLLESTSRLNLSFRDRLPQAHCRKTCYERHAYHCMMQLD